MVELVLGTAQLGLSYGITNARGQPSPDETAEILRSAVASGVSTLDTARAYGDCEERIGSVFAGGPRPTVVTKLTPLEPELSQEAAVAAAADSLQLSLTALRTNRLDVLLLHRPWHRTAWDGAVWRWLLDAKAAGRIGRLGVSLSTPAELLDALTCEAIEHVQLPFNMLDHRWEEAEVLRALSARPHVVVHARSALLQGLLSTADTAYWSRVAGERAAEITDWLSGLPRALDRSSLVQVALDYVRSAVFVHGLVVGVASVEELRDNVAVFGAPPLSAAMMDRVRATRPRLDERTLNPALW